MMKYKKETKKEVVNALKVVFLISTFFGQSAISKEALPELEIKKIEDGVYLHTSYEDYGEWGIVAAHGLVAIDGDRAVVIDTPAKESDTQDLLNWLDKNELQAKAVIATHFHGDSASGFALFNAKNIPTYATILTNQLLTENNRVQATHEIKEDSYWLVKDKVEVYYPGGGHSKDNIVVWLADTKILFGGCFVKPNHLGYLGDAVLAEWPQSTKNLLAKYADVKYVVPGHGAMGGKELLEKTLARVIDAANRPITK